MISIIFLAGIILQTFSGLLVIGRFYYKRAYISQKLCENRFDVMSVCGGKCVLVKELKKQEPTDQKIPNIKLQTIEIFCEHKRIESPNNIVLALNLIIPMQQSIDYCCDFNTIVFQPPPAADCQLG